MPARRERGYSGKSAACWTPADIDTLRSLHKTGQAYGAIAKAMNRSRGAIEKKCRELDLPKRWNFHAGNAARWNGHQKKPKGHNLYFGTGFHRRPKLATPPSFPKTPHPEGMKPVQLHERKGCCFPVNDGGPFLFCNQPTDDHSYCAHHWKRMVSVQSFPHPKHLNV